ncbi:MAG: hypothetical protein ACRCZB_05430 [Bacteroidales bacterium]
MTKEEQTIRDELLQQQANAEKGVHDAEKAYPEPVVIHRKELDKYGEEVETNDYVSYSPEKDEFKIFCKSRSLEFKGKEFDWIFDILRRIGSSIPTVSVSFMKGEEVLKSLELACGTKISQEELPPVDEGFLGWYLDEQFEIVFSIEAPIYTNTILYGKYE